MTSANYVDYFVIALYALLMVRVGFTFCALTGGGGVFKGGNRIPWLVAG